MHEIQKEKGKEQQQNSRQQQQVEEESSNNINNTNNNATTPSYHHQSRQHQPRCIFALNRVALAKIFKQRNRLVSVVGVFSADSAYDELKQMLSIAGTHVEQYKSLTSSSSDEDNNTNKKP